MCSRDVRFLIKAGYRTWSDFPFFAGLLPRYWGIPLKSMLLSFEKGMLRFNSFLSLKEKFICSWSFPILRVDIILFSSSNALSVADYVGCSSINLPYTSSPSWFLILNAIELGILLLMFGDSYCCYFCPVCFFWTYGDISNFIRVPSLYALIGDSTLVAALIERLFLSSLTSSSIAMLLNSSRSLSNRPLASLIIESFCVWDLREAVRTIFGKTNCLLF